MRVYVFDKWHRNSGVCQDIIKDYEEVLQREYTHHKELHEHLNAARQIIADRDREIAVLKKIGETGVHHDQHMRVVAECERLKFLNEEFVRDIETLEQRIYELEHPAPDTTIVRVTGPLKEPKRPKKVMDRLKVKDVVVLEDSVRKPKKPVKKVTKRGQKRGR